MWERHGSGHGPAVVHVYNTNMTAAQPATHTPGSKLTFLFFEMLAMMQSFRCPVRGCGVWSKGRDTNSDDDAKYAVGRNRKSDVRRLSRTTGGAPCHLIAGRTICCSRRNFTIRDSESRNKLTYSVIQFPVTLELSF